MAAERLQHQLLRVASVPAGHVYTRNIGIRYDGIRRFAQQGIRHPAQAMLHPDWIVRHSAEFDLFHLHFRFGGVSMQQLRAAMGSLKAAGKPLVYTLHDLEDPQSSEQTHHSHQLDELVRRSDAVVTLTSKAASVIYAKWGRLPLVIPHPHVVGLDLMGRTRVARTPRTTDRFSSVTAGVHLKSLRPGVEAGDVLAELLRLLKDRDWLRLRVDLNVDAAKSRALAALGDVLSSCHAHPRAHVLVHERFPDAKFVAYLASIDVAVLPYRIGTHSGWAEACLDIGTAVAAPRTTCISAQHREIHIFDLDDCGTLAVVLDKVREQPVNGWAPVARLSQRAEIARAHRELYEAILPDPGKIGL